MQLHHAFVSAAVLTATAVVAPPAHAGSTDFSVALTGLSAVQAGDRFVYEIVVRHEGKGRAGTSASVTLPAHLSVTGTGVNPSERAACTFDRHRVDCTFDSISGDKPVTVDVGVYAGSGGTGTTTATLGADAVASNNTASVTTTAVQPPPATQSFTAPYEQASTFRYGVADATTGQVAGVIPAGCTSECRGAGFVGQRVELSGVGPRTVDVAVSFDVEAIRTSLDAGVDVTAFVTISRDVGVHHRCSVDLNPVAQSAATGRVDVACSWPTALDGGRWLLVQAGLDVAAKPLVEAEAQAVVGEITVSGAPAA